MLACEDAPCRQTSNGDHVADGLPCSRSGGLFVFLAGGASLAAAAAIYSDFDLPTRSHCVHIHASATEDGNASSSAPGKAACFEGCPLKSATIGRHGG